MRSLIFILLIVSTPGLAQTQLEMNLEAYESYEKADKELNNVYTQIKKRYADDAVLLKELKNAQQAWIKLRDADVRMMYPERETMYYGSMHPMCVSGYMERLTIERTEKLRLWLKEDSDGCASSIK